jgi:hypothetical protein
MHRLLVVAVLVLAAAVPAAAAPGQGRPLLRLAELNPFVVRGVGFQPGERVRVALSARATTIRTVAASDDGRFTASFGDVRLGRCSAWAVSAAGSRGSRALLKLPPPMCAPE